MVISIGMRARAADMVGNLVAEAAARCRAEPDIM
jgi:hypothetical protein